MNDFQIMFTVSVTVAVITLAAVFVAARRGRGVEEPTDLLPEVFIDADDESTVERVEEILTDAGFDVLRPDPVVKHFDEAERLLRGECDPDIAAVFDRARLRPYEADFQTIAIRRLVHRLERLPRT